MKKRPPPPSDGGAEWRRSATSVSVARLEGSTSICSAPALPPGNRALACFRWVMGESDDSSVCAQLKRSSLFLMVYAFCSLHMCLCSKAHAGRRSSLMVSVVLWGSRAPCRVLPRTRPALRPPRCAYSMRLTGTSESTKKRLASPRREAGVNSRRTKTSLRI